MTIEEYIKEQRERVDNMTLAQARQVVADHYGHDDMRIECEKAVQMLLDCADEAIQNKVSEKVQQAYEDGKKDGYASAKVDEIKAEIWDLQYGDEEKSMTDEDRADAYNNAIGQVIEIINKYKAESEKA